MKDLQPHELAEIFPPLADAELKELSADIRRNGLQSSIVLYEGKILDGRNRYSACKMAGVEPSFAQYTGTEPLQHIISLNLHRRHLSESQRSIIGAKIADMQKGRPETLNPPIGGFKKVSEPEAATMLNVSTRNIQRAKKIMREAPEKVQEIERGEKTINRAMEEIKEKEKPHQTDKTEVIPRGNFDDSHKILRVIEEIGMLLDSIVELKPVKKWETQITSSVIELEKKIKMVLKNFKKRGINV